MSKVALTDLTIKSLKSEKRTDFWDTKLPAFGVRIGPRSKTFIAKVGNARKTLGNYPTMSLQEARRAFMGLKATKTPERAHTTFLEAYSAFKSLHVAQKKARTQKDYTRIVDLYFLPAFRDRPLDTITHRQITAITDELIHKPSEMSHAIAVGRTFFKFCVRRQYITASPIEGLDKPRAVARDRVLTDAELKAIWKTTGDGKIFSNIVRLLILTGQRRGEISQLQTSWIKENEIVFPKEITKNGREHILPLGALTASTIKMLESSEQAYTFPARGSSHSSFSGWMKSKLALDKKLGTAVAPWTLHDLRRTFATNLARLGIRLEITERLLNHVSGTQGGIVGVYQRHDFKNEKREAVERYEKWLDELVNGEQIRSV